MVLKAIRRDALELALLACAVLNCAAAWWVAEPAPDLAQEMAGIGVLLALLAVLASVITQREVKP